MGHCWRNGDELISDILLWTPSQGRLKAGWPARTYIQQLCADTGCSLEDLPGAMDDRGGRGSGRSMLAVWHDDDDDDDDVIYIPIYICLWERKNERLAERERERERERETEWRRRNDKGKGESENICFIDWFGLVLWHISHCRLFKAKSILNYINSFISNSSV